jgi:tetratricopeptide (TPR) repeat protein
MTCNRTRSDPKYSPAKYLGGAVLFLLLTGAGVALAAGGGGGGGAKGGGMSGGGSSGASSGSSSSATSSAPSHSSGSPAGTDLTTCNTGLVWDAHNQKCVAKHSGVLPDPDLTEYAYALAKAERYPEAIEILDLLDNPNTPRALNYRGYATRKMGRTEEGISYYMKSVALDPNYAQVREYLGEAYVIQGKFDLAKEQLATIQKLCGSTQCEEYEDLSDALTQAHAL